MIRPMVNRDSAYFWEGTQKGELRIESVPGQGTRVRVTMPGEAGA